jgi:hypothetical protein
VLLSVLEDVLVSVLEAALSAEAEDAPGDTSGLASALETSRLKRPLAPLVSATVAATPATPITPRNSRRLTAPLGAGTAGLEGVGSGSSTFRPMAAIHRQCSPILITTISSVPREDTTWSACHAA